MWRTGRQIHLQRGRFHLIDVAFYPFLLFKGTKLWEQLQTVCSLCSVPFSSSFPYCPELFISALLPLSLSPRLLAIPTRCFILKAYCRGSVISDTMLVQAGSICGNGPRPFFPSVNVEWPPDCKQPARPRGARQRSPRGSF